MKEKTLANWDEYEIEIRNLMATRARRKAETQTYLSPMLFRGHSNSNWPLKTTLERYSPTSLRALDYYNVIHGAKYGIESLTGQEWNVMTPPEYEKWLDAEEVFGLYELPGYDYMVYLRHHGFPSPLLDWTRSQYIAAYFAFCNSSSKTDYVSVYVYVEIYGQGKIGKRGEPTIRGRGPYVRSHRRHVLQQCEYTVCTRSNNGQWYYAFHEDVLSRNEENQDVIWKLNLPLKERMPILKRLDQNNINAYTLFGSEESLIPDGAVKAVGAPVQRIRETG